MDIRYFLNILKRRLWIILLVMFLAAVATYILVGKSPDTYKADAIMATGIIEKLNFTVGSANPFMQEFVTTTLFSNKIQNMTSPTTISLLTRKLLMHDLDGDDSRFRILASIEEEENGPSVDLETIERFCYQMNENLKLNLHPKEADRKHKEVFRKLSNAFEYDHESLMENMEIKRVGDTDFISVEFMSENPELSYYAVNTFCEEIIKYFQEELSFDEKEAVKFFAQQVEEKKAYFDSLTNIRNDFMAQNNVLNINEETKTIVGHVRDLELRKESASSKIPALEKNIRKLEFEIRETARETSESYALSLIHI